MNGNLWNRDMTKSAVSSKQDLNHGLQVDAPNTIWCIGSSKTADILIEGVYGSVQRIARLI